VGNRDTGRYELERSSSCRQEESINGEGDGKEKEKKCFKTEF
jgi:hypothetical protein